MTTTHYCSYPTVPQLQQSTAASHSALTTPPPQASTAALAHLHSLGCVHVPRSGGYMYRTQDTGICPLDGLD